METIEAHIQKDKEILDDSTISPQMRRHTEGELKELQSYQERHPKNHQDPSPLELYCDTHPEAPECLVYDD